ncbi:hypothetical protein ACWCXH_39090 [Kitasatospora sp. NPDC001660]
MTNQHTEHPGVGHHLPAPGLPAHTIRRGAPSPSVPGSLPDHSHIPEPPVHTYPGRPRAEAANPRPAGAWPIPRSQQVRTARTDETRVRFHVVLDTARAMLEEQPSERTVRSTARRLCAAVTLLADEIVAEKREAA